MSESKNKNGAGPGFFIRALAVWAISACILLLIAALIIELSGLGSSVMGYCSSAVSFLAALFAGFAAGRGENEGLLLKGIICSVGISLILISAGYLIPHAQLKPAGVLSVVSFTISGLLLGSIMSPIIFGGKKSKKIHPGRK